MNRAEVLDLVADLVERWPQQRDLDAPGSIDQYAVHFSEIDAQHARAAAAACYRDGEKWAPNAGQLLQRLADLVIDAPTFAQLKAALTGRAPADNDTLPELPDDCPHELCDGSGLRFDWQANESWPCRCREWRKQVRRARRGRHPLVAEFLRVVGSLEVADLATDRVAEAQIRAKWEAFLVGIRREITYRGIDPAGLPQLERIAADAKRRQLRAGEALHRPDVLRLIHGGDAAPTREAS